MQYSGCASITLPQSAAGTTCTSMMETPFTPLWLLSSGKRLLFWIGELWEGGNMEMTQVAFGTASKAPMNLHLCSQMTLCRQTMGLIITIIPQYTDKKKKILQLLTLAPELHFFFLELYCIFIFFPKDNVQACGWHSFILHKCIKKQ